jgi:hypothetical protein
MARNLEDLLSALADHELAQMRSRAQGEVSEAQNTLKRAEVELDLIERAVARKARRVGGGASSNATRDAVSGAFDGGKELTPAEVIRTVRANGLAVKDGAIRAMVRRLADEGHIVKLVNGRYSSANYRHANDTALILDAATGPSVPDTSPNGDGREGEARDAGLGTVSPGSPGNSL